MSNECSLTTLSVFTDGDIAELVRLFKNKTIKKTYMIPDYDEDSKYVELAKRMISLSEGGKRYVRGIYCVTGLIGMLNEVHSDSESIEVGYFISPEMWNKGYMTSALGQAIDVLFGRGYNTVIAGAFEENGASLRVMEKCGMKRNGNIETINYHDVDHRCIMCSINKPSGNESVIPGTNSEEESK